MHIQEKLLKKERPGIIVLIALMITFAGIRASFARAETPNYTPMAEIVNIVQKSGRYDAHDTYLDPENARKEYYDSLKYLNDDQVLSERDGVKQVVTYLPSKEVLDLVEKAKEMRERSKSEEAEKLLKEALAIDPGYSMIYVHLGDLYYRRGNYEEAIRWLDKAVEKNPINFVAYKLRADCHLKMDDLEKCRDDLIRAIIYNRNYRQAWESLEELGKKMGVEDV